jgi:2-hydroxychromene-2-carboxylate isomerase
MCEEYGAELLLRPMLLGAVHKVVGLQAPIYVKSKGSYQLWDIHRWAKHYGLPMKFPDNFPFRTLKTMRAAVALEGEGNLEPFTREAFGFYWEEGGTSRGFDEVDEDGPLGEVARRIGKDSGKLLEKASSGKAKEALKSATAKAIERGVFGAPAFFVGDEMFWGNDRLQLVEAALKAEIAGCRSGRRTLSLLGSQGTRHVLYDPWLVELVQRIPRSFSTRSPVRRVQLWCETSGRQWRSRYLARSLAMLLQKSWPVTLGERRSCAGVSLFGSLSYTDFRGPYWGKGPVVGLRDS